MSSRLLTLACLVTATTFAADAPKLPAIPSQPIAQKKELLFSDDFEKAELGMAWAIVVPIFSIEKGALRSAEGRTNNLRPPFHDNRCPARLPFIFPGRKTRTATMACAATGRITRSDDDCFPPMQWSWCAIRGDGA